ncbi:formin-binding protein 1-like isoform X5 [Octopus vulgaris]|uniref:Formin-binding protein 1-like isoform X5 n=1 Tax=Octopus vulgaris TaxID=6645 RepID=A0AA36AMT6_OCTVU|nr:formin-binding protein 1-like isoform X5 [Octopus vulgaris]
MSWGIELWDQYDNISSHTCKGIEVCEKYTHFLKERCAIELEYAGKLKKLVKNYQPKKKDEDECQFTSTKAFMDILRELFDLAGQHEIIAENTQIQIIKEIQQLVVELKQERKKGLQEGTKVQQSLILSTQQLDKTKKQYERAYREAEKAIEAYKKADADINLSRAEVEKQKNLSISKTQISEECKNDYAAQLEVTNKHQREYYSHLLPNVFQQLQDMDEKRISRLKSFLKSFADQEKRVLPIINTCIEGMFKAVDSISPKEDSRLVIERYKSGFTHPSDLPFEDLSCPTPGDSYPHNSAPRSQSSTDFKNQIKPGTVGGRTKKRGGLFSIFGSSKVDDQKEDFSDLPPNQRRKKLQQKIDLINKEIGKETAEREGMLKMKDVYINNPALGDASSLDKKLEENAQKLDRLNQELIKFENYMADAEGKVVRRHSTANDSLSNSPSESSVQSNTGPYISAPGTPIAHHYAHGSCGEDSENGPIAGGEDGGEEVDGGGEIDYADQESTEEEFDEFPVIGSCRALYQFEAMNEGSISMEENEQMFVLEQDQGDGWTRVRKKNGSDGFVPSSYIQCTLYGL